MMKIESYAEAQAVFERLNREYPRNVTALNELAFLAYRRGDLRQAEAWLRQALEQEPDNADARANLERVRRMSPPPAPIGKGR